MQEICGLQQNIEGFSGVRGKYHHDPVAKQFALGSIGMQILPIFNPSLYPRLFILYRNCKRIANEALEQKDLGDKQIAQNHR